MSTQGIRLPPRPSTGYNIVRSLQLEGRIHIPAEGCWPITSVRIAKGWGYPNEADFPQFGNALLFPPPEPPDLDQKAKKLRIAYYMRVYTAEQCAASLTYLSPVNAAFEITHAWDDPPDGRIPPPRKGEEIVESHAVLIVDVDEARQEFVFDSHWGPEWGVNGMGRLPFSYFKHRLVDAYSQTLTRPDLKTFRGGLRPVMNQFLWGQHIPGEPGNIVHIRELYDAKFDEYIGWAIVAERGEWLDVHELFVRPPVRRRGNGRGLMRMLEELSEERRKRLRFWVSFADIDTRSILTRMLRPMGYRLKSSPERWAAYLGVRDKINKGMPVPPVPGYVPARPTASSPPGVTEVAAALTVAAALLSNAVPDPTMSPKVAASEAVWEYPSEPKKFPGTASVVVEPAAGAPVAKVLKPGTDEFDRKNARRFELIEKKVDGELTPEEEVEFASLQSEILTVAKRHFPLPPFEHDHLLLKMKEGAEKADDSPK